MPQTHIDIVHRSEHSTDYYREDWFRNNRVSARTQPVGPEPLDTGFWPRYYSEVSRKGSGWFRFENAADLTIELLLEGELRYTQNGITELVRPGEVYLIHPGSDTVFDVPASNFFHRLRLMIYGSALPEMLRGLRLDGVRILRPPESEFRQWCDELRHLGQMGEKSPLPGTEAAELAGKSWQFLSELAEFQAAYPMRRLPERLEKILATLQKPGFPFPSVSQLAARENLEIHALLRLFRTHLGSSPGQFLQRRRMAEAEQLVGGTDLPMKEIAERLNFANALYFSTAFRKHFQQSPTQYRKQEKIRRNRD